MKGLLLSLLVLLPGGCGSPYPHFEASSVEYSLLGDFGELQAEVNALAEHSLISIGDGPYSYDVTQNTDAFEAYLRTRNVPKSLLGVCRTRYRVIIIIPADLQIDEAGPIPRLRIKSILAHEIGHAMGLEHTTAGLMAPVITSECVGREARCLVDALRSAQKM